jgi:hypothetical protein
MILDRPALIKNGVFSFTLIVLLLALVFALVGCQRYFKSVRQYSSTVDEKMDRVNENISRSKFFILRSSSGNYEMKNIQLDQQAQTITFQLDYLPPIHQLYTNRYPKWKYRKSMGEQVVLEEVHLFSKGTQLFEIGKTITLPANDIQRIEVIESDGARTTGSYIIGGIGLGLGAFAVFVVIVALTKSSCPFVSVYNGKGYDLEGELFGGALYPSSERADYVPLKIKAVNGEYKIRISNELQERQYTDFAKLLVISHDKSVKALTDLQGKIHTVATTIAPLKAIVNDKKDVTASVSTQDTTFCAFNDTTSKDNFNSLVLTFSKPAASKSARMLLQLRNSYWFDYLYGEFNKAFGNYYNEWMKQQEKVPASEHDSWSREQHIPMQVSVKTDTGWREICNVKSIGPLMNREVLIPIELQQVNGKQVEVKLTTGFMFWELDYAGIDYSSELPYSVQSLDPYKAVDEKGKSVLNAVKQDDHLYLEQLYPGTAAVLKYKIKKQPNASEATSVILYTKGYYQPIRDYKGNPDLSRLKSFRSPGAFAAFSRQRFDALKHENLFAINQN